MNLTERIERAREERRLRKADLARVLDVDPSQYNKLEKRGNSLTIDQAKRIAGALGLGLVELLTYGEEKQVDATASGGDVELAKLHQEKEAMTVKLENYAVLIKAYERTLFDLIANDLNIKAHFTYEDENGIEVAEKYTPESDERIKSLRMARRRVVLGVYEEDELRQIITAALTRHDYKGRGLALIGLAPELLHPMWRKVAISLNDGYFLPEG